jgi:hypothetical protein
MVSMLTDEDREMLDSLKRAVRDSNLSWKEARERIAQRFPDADRYYEACSHIGALAVPEDQ